MDFTLQVQTPSNGGLLLPLASVGLRQPVMPHTGSSVSKVSVLKQTGAIHTSDYAPRIPFPVLRAISGAAQLYWVL